MYRQNSEKALLGGQLPPPPPAPPLATLVYAICFLVEIKREFFWKISDPLPILKITFKVYLYPENIFWYVKGTQIRSPLHQHSIKNIFIK